MFSPDIFLERKLDIKKKNELKTCKWCYLSYNNLNKTDHEICNSKLKKALRSRRQNIDLVSRRVDKYSSPRHNQNKYLTEAQNQEILKAYEEISWMMKNSRLQN